METLQQIRDNLARFERRRHPLAGRRHAAVAVALTRDEAGRACFVLTRRTNRLSRHAGQWALPGGRIDPGETPEQAALRELAEEVGLHSSEPCVLGKLDDYPTRSGYVITPVVTTCPEGQALKPNPDEVAAAYHVPLSDLEKPEVPHLRRIPESERPVIAIPLVGALIHAPTAAVLFQLREVGMRGLATRVDHYEQPVFAWK